MHLPDHRFSHRHQTAGGGLLIPHTGSGRRSRATCDNVDTGCLRLIVAATFRQRLLGLHACAGLPWHTGLCIMPCHAIHTFGLRHPIDVVFLNRHGEVIRRIENLPPWRAAICLRAACVVELPAGYCVAHPDYPRRIRLALCCGLVQAFYARRGAIVTAPTDDSSRTR